MRIRFADVTDKTPYLRTVRHLHLEVQRAIVELYQDHQRVSRGVVCPAAGFLIIRGMRCPCCSAPPKRWRSGVHTRRSRGIVFAGRSCVPIASGCSPEALGPVAQSPVVDRGSAAHVLFSLQGLCCTRITAMRMRSAISSPLRPTPNPWSASSPAAGMRPSNSGRSQVL